MPTDGFEPVLRMTVAFGFVAAVAVPVGLLCRRLGRRSAMPPLPAPTADDPVVALGYLMLFGGHLVGTSILGQVAEAAGLVQRAATTAEPDGQGVWRSVLGSLLSAPVLLAVWLGFRFACHSIGTWRAAAWVVAVGVGGWLMVSPAVYAVNGVAEWASTSTGVVPQEHPLVKVVATADAGRAVVLFAAVAVATPFAEEVVFRGLLLGWLIRRPGWAVVPVGMAAVLALSTTAGTTRLMAAGFLVVLAAGLVVVRRRPAVAAVWATATLFAAVHSTVWPTPVPLFLLGLALGAVAVRTGGVLAGTVLHGLFNAVSLVYLLRG